MSVYIFVSGVLQFLSFSPFLSVNKPEQHCIDAPHLIQWLLYHFYNKVTINIHADFAGFRTNFASL